MGPFYQIVKARGKYHQACPALRARDSSPTFQGRRGAALRKILRHQRSTPQTWATKTVTSPSSTAQGRRRTTGGAFRAHRRVPGELTIGKVNHSSWTPRTRGRVQGVTSRGLDDNACRRAWASMIILPFAGDDRRASISFCPEREGGRRWSP